MTFVAKLADRVLETTTTTGTGAVTLAGAVTGFQSFAAIGNGIVCHYFIEAVDANGVPTGDWEVGIGTYTAAGTSLSRTTILASSNSGSAVNLSAGTKLVGVVAPSNILQRLLHGQRRSSVSSSVTSDDFYKVLIATGACTWTLPTLDASLLGVYIDFIQSVDANMVIAGDANIIAKGSTSASTITYNTTSEKVGSHCRIKCIESAIGTYKWVHQNLGGTAFSAA